MALPALLAQAQPQKNGKKMSEPRYLEGDDIALRDECDECGNFIHSCECMPYDPDTLHDQRFDD